ncbi:MAG: cellulase [Henriciella sp.]|nr:cellulase [Henriciella sp.]MBF35423.1 cellulase [Hyphomonadaceae bacterium]PHR79346.1 MAG: cellulase [Henriciella sp.]
MATLRALDKITGRSTDFEIEVGKPVVYGVLEVDLKVCFQTPPEEPPESAAFLQITEADYVATNTLTEPRLLSDVKAELDAADRKTAPRQPAEKEEEAGPLFSGWMFASSPGLSALEHPVYDVWVIRCKQPSPESLSSPASPDE